ncbi:MAG: hypothetical protein KGK07_15660 [Chloroflexota bacterium]|nr:hypothetical protein [Chloroflexota bacterium]
MTSLRPARCIACGRPLPPTQRALVGYWPTVRDLLWWLAWDDGYGAGCEVRAVYVCRGASCGDARMRQRVSAEACAGRVGR